MNRSPQQLSVPRAHAQDVPGSINGNTALQLIARCVQCEPQRRPMQPASGLRMRWATAALEHFGSLLSQHTPAPDDAQQLIRQLELLCAVIACWPALYPYDAHTDMHHAALACGYVLGYRHDSHGLQIVEVTRAGEVCRDDRTGSQPGQQENRP